MIAVVGFLFTLVLMTLISSMVRRTLAGGGEASALGRSQGRRERDASPLTGPILVAVSLFVCSHPAADAVNMLFFERGTLRHVSEWSVLRWLALNLATLVAGWVVIFVALRRIVERVV